MVKSVLRVSKSSTLQILIHLCDPSCANSHNNTAHLTGDIAGTSSSKEIKGLVRKIQEPTAFSFWECSSVTVRQR
uniref:Secreted protein n=1 Tax=Steinernema glaseri TaxID=37863 RepID=A0A1I7ZHW8_9BILA